MSKNLESLSSPVGLLAPGIAVAATFSAGYGSGIVPAGTGLLMNNSVGEIELVPFLAGNDCTVADIALYAYTHVADEGRFDLLTKKEALELSRDIEKMDRNLGGIKGIKGLVGLSYYEIPAVQESIGYTPQAWIDKVGERYRFRFKMIGPLIVTVAPIGITPGLSPARSVRAAGASVMSQT